MRRSGLFFNGRRITTEERYVVSDSVALVGKPHWKHWHIEDIATGHQATSMQIEFEVAKEEALRLTSRDWVALADSKPNRKTSPRGAQGDGIAVSKSTAPVWVENGYWWGVHSCGSTRLRWDNGAGEPAGGLPAETDRAEAIKVWLTTSTSYDEEQWRRRRLAEWSPSRVPIQTNRPKVSAQTDAVAVVTMTKEDLDILLRRAAEVATDVAFAKFAEIETAGVPMALTDGELTALDELVVKAELAGDHATADAAAKVIAMARRMAG
jgi:hypothetical protein